MPPTVINPPILSRLNAINKPIMVLIGNNNNAITSELFIAIIFEFENISAKVIINKKTMTKEPKSLADQRIIFKTLCFCT